MDSFVKKIFNGNMDEHVHLQFEKYGRGEYRNKAVIIARNVKGVYNITTTSEFANEFVRAMAEKLGKDKANVTGIVVSTRDLTGELNFKNKKQFMGVKQYVLDGEMSGDEIIVLMDKFPRCFFGLSFTAKGSELKVKPKAPKSAKPSTKPEDKLKADFCKLKTQDAALMHGVLFDTKEFKRAEAKHTFVINDILLPKNVDDPRQLREMAKRKGKIIREITVDGMTVKEEKDFLA